MTSCLGEYQFVDQKTGLLLVCIDHYNVFAR